MKIVWSDIRLVGFSALFGSLITTGIQSGCRIYEKAVRKEVAAEIRQQIVQESEGSLGPVDQEKP